MKKIFIIAVMVMIAVTASARIVKYQDEVRDTFGNAVRGASVSVLLTGTSTTATLYSSAAGTQALANPVTTSGYGVFSFFVEEGTYDLSISKAGFTTQSTTSVLIGEPILATHSATTGTNVHGLGTMSTQNANSVLISGGTATVDNLYVTNTICTTPTYTSGNFTASGSMTWTVEAVDVASFQLCKIGKTLLVNFALVTTSVGGTPSTGLRITIPYVIAKDSSSVVRVIDGPNAAAMGYAYAATGTTYITIYNDALTSSSWSASTNQTSIRGQIFIEVL